MGSAVAVRVGNLGNLVLLGGFEGEFLMTRLEKDLEEKKKHCFLVNLRFLTRKKCSDQVWAYESERGSNEVSYK